MLARLLCFVVLFAAPSLIHAATLEDWQGDLRELQQTAHRDYPFLFRKVSAADFDREVAALEQALPTAAPHQAALGFARLVSLFGYGHTSVHLPSAPAAFHTLPLQIYAFKDGVFIEGVHRNHAETLGSRLLAVEGVPIEQAIHAIKPVVPVENESFFQAYGLNYLLFPEVLHAQGVTPSLLREVTLTLEKDGQTFTHRFPAETPGLLPNQFGFTRPNEEWLSLRPASSPLFLRELDRVSFAEYLPEQMTLYVRQNEIQDDPRLPLPAFFAQVFEDVRTKDVDRLILDLRHNGGGNNQKLKPIIVGLIQATKVNQRGKLFVLTGRRTFSACQNLVSELKRYTEAIFIGEPTAENLNFFGDARQVVLPRTGMRVALSFAWWQDVPVWEEQPSFIPHLTVVPTSEDFRLGHDPVLEAALVFDATGFVPDPMAYLSELFLKGDLDRVRAEAFRLVHDPRHQFVDYEASFLRIAQQLRDIQQLPAARGVLELSHALFPASDAVTFRLGEVRAQTGDGATAADLFRAVADRNRGELGREAAAALLRLATP